METIHRCLLCGSSHKTILGKYPTLEVANICQCGLIYLSPRPYREKLATQYGDGTFATLASRYTDEWVGRITYQANARSKMVNCLCGEYDSILDIGCSEGAFLDMFPDKEAMGIDPSTNREEFICGEFPEDMPDKKYDVITMFHCIEHIGDPVNAIMKTHKFLNDNGSLVVEYPDIGRKLMRDGAYIGKMLDNPFHLYEFTMSTIERLLNICGYIVKDVVFFSGNRHDNLYKNVALIAKKYKPQHNSPLYAGLQ